MHYSKHTVDSQLIQHLQDLQRPVASIRAHDDDLSSVRVRILGLDLLQEVQVGSLLDCLVQSSVWGIVQHPRSKKQEVPFDSNYVEVQSPASITLLKMHMTLNA